VSEVLTSVIQRGDLAHLALFLWACGASWLLYQTHRAHIEATRRFDDFVRALANFNNRYSGDDA
jgi:hypothetical protein